MTKKQIKQVLGRAETAGYVTEGADPDRLRFPYERTVDASAHDQVVDGLLTEVRLRQETIERLKSALERAHKAYADQVNRLMDSNTHFKGIAEGFARELHELKTKKVQPRKTPNTRKGK